MEIITNLRKSTRRIIALVLILCMVVGTPALTLTSDAASTTTAPSATKVTSLTKTSTTFTVKWEKVEGVSGYEIEYASNRFFLNPSAVTVTDSKTTIKKVKSKRTLIYVRVRTYTKSGDKTYRSAWALSNNTKTSKEAIINKITKSGKQFELRSAANQKVGKFDTLQGGCAYGNTGWYVLYNRSSNKCKIIKVNLKTKKVTKVSGELNVSHGSTLTYNPRQKVLVVAHGPSNYKRISVISPSTLTVSKVVTLKMQRGTKGASHAAQDSFKGVISLAYNNKYNMYVGKVKGKNRFVTFDKDFNSVSYFKMGKKGTQLYQTIDSYSDYILVGQSPNKNGKYNLILVYDWEGNYLSTVRLNRSYELETIYHNNGNLYAGYYRSYYKTYYVDGFRIKTTNGSKNKVKTKLKYTKLMRDNYIYKVTNL